MSFLCAANWKMNLSLKETQSFLVEFNQKLAHLKPIKPLDGLRSSFCFFPQAVQAPLFLSQKNLNWGAQDFYFESAGAYTGQNSPNLFQELGANIMLVGHSERRALFFETDKVIAKKIKKCSELNLIPMLCIGETLEEKQRGETLKALKRQLDQGLEYKPKSLIVAYEPVWAIGTGMTATAQDVQTAHELIKGIVGQATPVLYGGSVKPENARELSVVPNMDGFLIGGASLTVDSLLAIYNNSVK